VGAATGLTESYEVALKRVIELAGVVDEGRGILLLVDMGSLTEIGDAVMEKTGIPVRSIARVDTLMALDAVRRASLEDASLDEVAQAIRWSQGFPAEPARTREGLKPALITVCLTGEGNARRLKGYLESSVLNASDDIAIFEIGLLNAQRQREEIDRIRREYHILAITGTMDPEVPGIPFYPMGYVFGSQGLLALMGLISEYQGQKTSLIDVVRPELILFEPEPTITKNEIIDGLCASMEAAGMVTDGFLLSVYKREMMGSTCMTQERIAVPHGDSACVTKPAIAVAKLARPVVWSEDNVADLVFLFAFDNSCRKYAEKFSQLTEEKQRISDIRGARSKGELLKYLNF
jgi:mannitol/fructose-specific phosphotransferase system IIA component (Ntr-type)